MCTDRLRGKAQAGFTLVELILTIVILSIVSVGLMQAQATIVSRSADPMLERQSLAIAESYLEEILSKAYLDPATGSLCPAAPGGGRAVYDNVCDYSGLSGAPADQWGTALADLSAYSVAVTVASSSQLNGLANTEALRITVAVTDPLSRTLRLSGYRAR